MNAEQQAAKTRGDELGLSFYVWMGHVHVDDGGRRAFGEVGWSGGVNGSYRPATDEETELWELVAQKRGGG